MNNGGLPFKRYIVTGAAGFIGSNLVDVLLSRGADVVGIDNLSSGFENFLNAARANPRFSFHQQDILDTNALVPLIGGADCVIHLAANADVRFGTNHPRKDLEQNTIATASVLEAMRLAGVTRIAFASTGSVYGEPEVFPTPEQAPFPIQTSLYAASKLAGEGLLSAYASGFGFTSWIFRFVSILGERYTHGHVFDFVKQLRENPEQLLVQGDGLQRKSYLHVGDCIAAMLLVMENSQQPVSIFNLGHDDYINVKQSIAWISGHLGVSPQCVYSGGVRGWIGDSPFIFLDNAKLRAVGWQPGLSIENSVCRTVDWLQSNNWVFEARA